MFVGKAPPNHPSGINYGSIHFSKMTSTETETSQKKSRHLNRLGISKIGNLKKLSFRKDPPLRVVFYFCGFQAVALRGEGSRWGKDKQNAQKQATCRQFWRSLTYRPLTQLSLSRVCRHHRPLHPLCPWSSLLSPSPRLLAF